MIHKDPICALTFSEDDEILASADKTGLIKVFLILL